MPTLKQLTCNVEWSGSNLPLHEYQTIYADGFVETYVAVPPVSTPFSIHLRSHGYIAPGLAMFVYMDGEYQCNRNRSNLKIPSEARTRKQTEIDFHVRQKEELMPDGSFRGKQWKFVSMRTDDANKSFETLYHNISAKRPAPHDSQYIGTIEVVVLRCYPNQTSKHITPSIPVAESIPFVQSQLHTSSLAVDIEAGSQSSSDEESESSKGAASMMVEMFDGAADYPWTPPESTSFGGDMALDQAPSFQGRTQPRRPLYGGHTEGKESGNPSSTPTGNEHHFSTSESQKWHNRVAPERRGHGHENNAAQNIPPSSGRNSHHEPDKYTPNPPNRVPRHSPGTKSQKAHNSNGSNERSSNSNRSHHSPACSTAPRTNPSAVWVQPQGTPAQVAPAVVINVTQGTPHSANSTSPVKTPTLNIETAKVDVWQTGQPEKIDEYIQGPSQSPEGSNDSKASKRWNNSIASPVDNHADVLRHENSIEQHDGTQWHDTFSHAENNENQWDVVEDTWDSKLEHTTPKYHDDHQTWDNNMVGSYPLESSSMEAQNTSNGWSSNENNNASYHTVGEANIGNEQARLENSSAWTQPTNSMGGKSPRRLASGQPKGTDIGSGRAEKKRLGKFLSALLISNKPRRSVHPSPSGQGRQQTSLHPSNKSTAAKVACANDTSNSQYLGTNDNEASKYVASQPWSEQVPEQNEHGLESPQLAAPQIYELPVSIDTRARPYWSAWKQPHINKITSKAAVPRVEPAEPLYYVPSEVAQKNKMSHQVYVGQTAEYVHKRASPRYMDDFTSPYAVFVFKYRSKGNATN